jgi:hypothetical protein
LGSRGCAPSWSPGCMGAHSVAPQDQYLPDVSPGGSPARPTRWPIGTSPSCAGPAAAFSDNPEASKPRPGPVSTPMRRRVHPRRRPQSYSPHRRQQPGRTHQFPRSSSSIPSARGRLSRRLSGYSEDCCGWGATLSPIANLFWNARERRLRAGWRLLVFLAIVFLVAAVDGRVRAGLAGRLPDLYEDLVRALVFALLIAAALYLASRVLDHRRMSDYGFHFSQTCGATSASDWCWAPCCCSGFWPWSSRWAG